MRKSISPLLLILLATVAVASDDKTDRATLRGLKAVCTIVEINGPAREGVTITKEQLQAEVDGRLAAAGIPQDKDSTACLYLNMRPLPAMGKGNKPAGLYALEMSIEVLQTVAVTRDASLKTYAPTWSFSNLATVPTEDLRHTARQMAIDLADRFVDAYRSANPK
jgi:hypothetical protein